MLTIILGNLGSGKTLIMSMLSLIGNKDIWSNYKINSKKYKSLEIPDLFNLPDNINLLIDEAYAWLESRVSSSTLNEYLSSILYHSRKAFTDIYLTTPELSTIDKRFRKLADYYIFCQHRNDYDIDDFHFLFYNKNNNTFGSNTLLYSDAKSLFPIYDTLEKVESYRKKGLQYNILKNYPERLKDYILELTELVISKLNGKITHDIVKNCLLMEKIDLKYEPLIYIRIKGIKNDSNNKTK